MQLNCASDLTPRQRQTQRQTQERIQIQRQMQEQPTDRSCDVFLNRGEKRSLIMKNAKYVKYAKYATLFPFFPSPYVSLLFLLRSSSHKSKCNEVQSSMSHSREPV